ncbi:hypothetical protein L1049_001250 [Liquidambar formosana]|uniref:Uncharacterized protein n=1 Tax=Liquidambar formosana TaxID=63359 RepID=A0AAP0R5E1_LIQFO
MVNSWAYTLQSLELDAQVMAANPRLTTVGSPVNFDTCVDNQVRSMECKENISNRGSHESGALEESPQGCVAENIERVDLNNGVVDFDYPNSEGRVAVSEEGPPQKMVFLGHSAPDIPRRSSLAAADDDDGDRVDGKILNEENGTNSESCRSHTTGNHRVADGDFGSLKQSNGFAFTESAVVSGGNVCSSSDLAGVKFSNSRKVSDQIDGLSSMETGFASEDGQANPTEHIVSSNKATILSADTGVVCLYCCCAECLYALHSLMQKILMHEWGLHRSHWTVDDAHDVVAALSVNLLSEFQKACGAESFRNSFDKNPRHGNQGIMFEPQAIGTCQCKNSENRLVTPMKCSRHSISENLTAKENTSPLPQLELDTKFIYRDGVLAPLDPDKDISFHCKFEPLCLCSLIEWIVTTKQLLD